MSYANCRDGLLKTLQAVQGFTPDTVLYEDFKCVNAGVQRCMVVEYQSFSEEAQGFQGAHWCDWEIKVSLFNQFTDIVAAQGEQDADRESILQMIRSYPKLQGTAGVFYASIVRGESVPAPIELGGAIFLREQLTVNIREEVDTEELE